MKPDYTLIASSCVFLGSFNLLATADEPGAVPSATANVDGAGKPVQFTVYDRPYFVKNTFEPGAAESFAVLKNLQEFENVFGVGMVMGGTKPQISDTTFKLKIIVAVVKRGPMCQYTVDSVAVKPVPAKGNRLELRYTAKRDPPGTAAFAVPLIVEVPKGDIATVAFIENGKEIGTRQIVSK